jgi:tungstate transport system substrate-binding protein
VPKKLALAILIILFCSPVFAADTIPQSPQKDRKVIRAAVIGGMSLTTDLWNEISKMFEADTGYKVEVVAAGPRPRLAQAMRKGKVDLLTMHSGDITTDLVADGYAVNMRPWARNDLVIIGPKSDPAGICGMKDGVAALKRIAGTKSNFIDFKGIGPRELGNSLWKKAGVRPVGSWVIKDDSRGNADILKFVERNNAYMIIGRVPVITGKLGKHNLKIMVEKDPVMRRPYIVMEANPQMFPDANVQGAKTLADYLLSEKIQTFLSTFGKESNNGIPLYHPVSIKRGVSAKISPQ